ncbi:ABC transporter permease [Gordonia sp. (in: high G+C Gram-positive bacteria)]|uniref:ABC transporter permease n=1 Tax=Gordonia sp. (in: high G+C Gram-positive bacteria) TaxID=84139 RepID=UPI0039E42A19
MTVDTPRPASSGPAGDRSAPDAETTGRAPRASRGRRAARLLVRRLAIAVPTLGVVSFAIFALAAASPFDPLAAHLGDSFQNASRDQREAVRAAYDLDQNWFSAWWHWWGGVFTGDLGWSSTLSRPVSTVLAERMPFTFTMSLISLILAAAIAVVAGSVIGMRRGGPLDRICGGLAVILASTPPFVVSLLLVTVFSVSLHLLPTSGARRPGDEYTLGGLVTHGILPTVALVLSLLPWLLLSMRSAVTEALDSDAVFAARARGIDGRRLMTGHVLPVSVLPTLALLGTRLPELIAGAAVVESVFGWPGLAQALVDSATALDFPLLAALAVGSAILVLLGSALSDAAAVWLDPRIEMTA